MGVNVAHYEYDPFGRAVAQSGTYADQNPWRFSTKQMELAWNLYYYGHRFYSPNLHTFLSRDPIADLGVKASRYIDTHRNLYSFVLNSPGLWSDPLGMIPSYRGKREGEEAYDNEETTRSVVAVFNAKAPTPCPNCKCYERTVVTAMKWVWTASWGEQAWFFYWRGPERGVVRSDTTDYNTALTRARTVGDGACERLCAGVHLD